MSGAAKIRGGVVLRRSRGRLPPPLRSAIRFGYERAASASLPLKRGGMGWGSRPPPDRCAVDLPLAGGGEASKPPNMCSSPVPQRESSQEQAGMLWASFLSSRRAAARQETVRRIIGEDRCEHECERTAAHDGER